jgi:hypothetical protein
VLQWARANGCPWDVYVCEAAAAGGHPTVIGWARANGGTWDESTFACAAVFGSLSVLHFLRANGCPWDEHVCRAAVRGAHLTALQWARANGCPWGSLTVAGARALMEAQVLEEGEPLHELERAYYYEDTPFASWENYGDDADTRAAKKREAVEAVLEWLRASGCAESEAVEADESDSESDSAADE